MRIFRSNIYKQVTYSYEIADVTDYANSLSAQTLIIKHYK